MGWWVLLQVPLLGKGRVLRWQSWGRKEQTWEAKLALQLPECHGYKSPPFYPPLPTKTRVGTLWPLPNSRKHSFSCCQWDREPVALSLPLPLNIQRIPPCYWCRSVMGMLSPGSVTRPHGVPRTRKAVLRPGSTACLIGISPAQSEAFPETDHLTLSYPQCNTSLALYSTSKFTKNLTALPKAWWTPLCGPCLESTNGVWLQWAN